MIVRVRSKDGPNLFIPLPTGLFCSRLTAGIVAKAMAQNGITATPEQMYRLFRAIRQYKRRHPDWVMVEVESAAGESVSIKF